MAGSQPNTLPLVAKVNVQALNVPLLSPFTVASAVVEQVNNVAVQVMLSTGHSGWGEISIMPPITAEDQPFALDAAKRVAQWLPGHAANPWQAVLKEVAAHIPGHQYAAVRAGFEMALLDALAQSQEVPLWRFFGGASDRVTTDITIPICPPQEAAALAFTYKQQGFETIKTKVGKEPKDDIIRLRAIRFSHPQCRLILDANEGYTPNEALDVLRLLQDAGMSPILLEQPVARDDWEGLKEVTQQANRVYGVSVAADESCRSAADARRIAENRIANVLNIKLAKCGVAGALETVAIAKEYGLELMMGGMVETRLAMGFAAHLVAGVGGFRYVDLDTPLLLASDPVQGGYSASGPHYSLGSTTGHGASLAVVES
ncbi:hypothetical protein KFL_000250510 [Klebsormidium nitens]|uniref:Dipeptide epimerase n=2 Tax=Klebsormidium TaxID=3174 RepID=A0A1Y1HKP3_KLENI|nr:hypothetical protein KFL_000250510 [Klebsormidium nitens]|eukprot:GAQ79174.1 hypothetical protein KFL_000250510 [Klebsormidium nitens]